MKYLLFLALLTGCATGKQWQITDGKTMQDYYHDKSFCEQRAMAIGGYNAQSNFDECMYGQGWKSSE
jgi:hypothetical protein